MRLPRLRFTMRWMLVGVAVVALASAATALVIQADRRDRRASYHAKKEAETRALMRYYEGNLVVVSDAVRETFPPKLARSTRRNDYHVEMRRKWEQAARNPWLHVEPDPPEPE